MHNQEDLIRMRTDRNVHKTKPGVTGWAQVNGRDELDINEKVQMDYYYHCNKSFLLDLKIFWLTIIKVIKADGVSN